MPFDAFRERIRDLGARPAIPPKRTDAPVACPDWVYANRHLVENLWARLKEWRAVATRYAKTARSFLGGLSRAATRPPRATLRARLKEWRAVATRYEKTARSFLGVLSLAATCDWLGS